MPYKYGVAQYPVSLPKMTKTLSIMDQYKMTVIRISSTPPWKTQGTHGLNESLIDLAVSKGYTVIIDPIHLYPPNNTTAADAKAHRPGIIKCFKDLGAKYRLKPNVEFEIINEYQNHADFYGFMQGIIIELRAAGVVNAFVINKPPKYAPAWKVLNDPLGKARQGFHPYMDYWEPSAVTTEIDRGLKILPGLVLTEFGASTKEGPSYTDALVTEVNQVMELNKDKDVTFCLWLNNGWSPNWPEYEAHHIVFPTPTPPPKIYHVFIENQGTGNLSINGVVYEPQSGIQMDVGDGIQVAKSP